MKVLTFRWSPRGILKARPFHAEKITLTVNSKRAARCSLTLRVSSAVLAMFFVGISSCSSGMWDLIAAAHNEQGDDGVRPVERYGQRRRHHDARSHQTPRTRGHGKKISTIWRTGTRVARGGDKPFLHTGLNNMIGLGAVEFSSAQVSSFRKLGIFEPP